MERSHFGRAGLYQPSFLLQLPQVSEKHEHLGTNICSYSRHHSSSLDRQELNVGHEERFSFWSNMASTLEQEWDLNGCVFYRTYSKKYSNTKQSVLVKEPGERNVILGEVWHARKGAKQKLWTDWALSLPSVSQSPSHWELTLSYLFEWG